MAGAWGGRGGGGVRHHLWIDWDNMGYLWMGISIWDIIWYIVDVPSGKRWHNYGISPFLIEKSHINGHVPYLYEITRGFGLRYGLKDWVVSFTYSMSCFIVRWWFGDWCTRYWELIFVQRCLEPRTDVCCLRSMICCVSMWGCCTADMMSCDIWIISTKYPLIIWYKCWKWQFIFDSPIKNGDIP